MTFALYVFVGAVAGFLSGLLGIGGGLIFVPCLVFVFSQFNIVASGQLMHLVLGTSLACSAITLIASCREHRRHQAIKWPIFYSLLPGLLAGALLLGPGLMLIMNAKYLRIIFGVFCFLSSLYMLKSPKQAELTEQAPNKYVLSVLGLIAGGLSTLLGIAGGVFIGSILNYYKIDPRKVVGTTAMAGLAITFPGSLSLLILGFHKAGLPHWSTGYIYWPALVGITLPSFFIAPWGAKLAHKLPVLTLKRLFAALVFIVGLKMLV